MKLFYKTILIVSILLLISTTKYYGQTADLQFMVTHNDQTVNGTYSVKTQIKLNPEADMGTSAIQFTFNTTGLNFPSSPVENTDYEYHNFQGSIPGGVPFTFYVSTVTRPISGKVSINIVLSLGADGQTVTTDWMDIVTLSFTILDVNETSNLQWVSETTTIFDDLNQQFTNGTLTDENTPLPVELSSFTADIVNETCVELNWKTQTEVSNYGFDIERSIKSSENDEPLWVTIGFIEGSGNSNSPKIYGFRDTNPNGGSKFLYRLKQIDNDGQYEFSDEVEIELLPTKYELYQNYPNPFNPNTNIKFSLPEDAKVSIRIYNMLGELIDELVNQEYETGFHKIEFNATSYASGVYIYRLVTNNFTNVKKMVLLK